MLLLNGNVFATVKLTEMTVGIMEVEPIQRSQNPIENHEYQRVFDFHMSNEVDHCVKQRPFCFNNLRATRASDSRLLW